MPKSDKVTITSGLLCLGFKNIKEVFALILKEQLQKNHEDTNFTQGG